LRGSDAIVVAGDPAVNRWTAWLENPRWVRTIVFALMATQAGLLAYSATRHSPTHLGPAFLASGISHWQFGRFELYRVNPPLVRLLAALPTLAVGCKTDWCRGEQESLGLFYHVLSFFLRERKQ
jgi:hypothetical protein